MTRDLVREGLTTLEELERVVKDTAPAMARKRARTLLPDTGKRRLGGREVLSRARGDERTARLPIDPPRFVARVRAALRRAR